MVNSTSYVAGDLHFVMGISAYQVPVGSAVDFYLSVYNSGSSTVVIPNPGQVSAIHSWSVLPDTCDNLYEPENCIVDTPYLWPEGVFFFGVPTSVAAGQCITKTTHWSGQHWGNPNLPVQPGTYHVVGGWLVGWDEVTSQGAPLLEMELPLTIIGATSGVPGPAVESLTWSGIKSRVE